MRDFDDHIDGEFDAITRALDAHRPQTDPLALDRIKLDARRRAAQRARSQLSQKGLFMRSRVFITSLVAGGILMLGGGAALGVSGLSATRSASIAQYGTTPSTPTTPTNVVTNVVTPGTTTTTTGTTTQAPTETTSTDETPPTNENLGENANRRPAGAVQGARQVASNELPFTGYLAIPILILGLAMLAGGFALRRSQRRLES
jgi:hypothetical protein